MELMETDAMFLLRRLIGADSVQTRIPGGPRKLVRKFGKKGPAKGQFNMVCGVTFTKTGDIIVADTENHRIQIFTDDGLFKLKFGQKGPDQDKLNYPMCVVMTPDENIAVTDTVNARLKIFSQEGEFVREHGDDGVFDFPYGLAMSSDGWFVVTDICKHNVTVLNPEGGVYTQFGSYGDGPLEFDHPYYVAIDKNKQIIVSDNGNTCVKFFTFDGQPIQTFNMADFKLHEEHFISLQGLCIDSDNNIIIIGNNTVYILAINGRFWEIILPREGVTSPKCIAFSPSGYLVLTQSNLGQAHEVLVFNYNMADFRSLHMLPLSVMSASSTSGNGNSSS
ncbi:E3 ubiquitin-protein ligase TRIM71-like [Lineus longissimus]|uniref:E3 ubiquitin-protein ligase TRIM71-like n=1 Tax=Lineus longissimus TaxID=88925 RepID=UPI002B4EEAE2